MLDETSKKLLKLVESGTTPELRIAAARVLGEVGVRDAELGRVLTIALEDADSAVRLQILRTIGQLRFDVALPSLLARIREGGPEAEVAAQAAAQLGAK